MIVFVLGNLTQKIIHLGRYLLVKFLLWIVYVSMIQKNAISFKNPTNPGLVCGGEYSGSAVLVASTYADFALGIETIGEIRVFLL